jgi:predicted Na+-dependent transporter
MGDYNIVPLFYCYIVTSLCRYIATSLRRYILITDHCSLFLIFYLCF